TPARRRPSAVLFGDDTVCSATAARSKDSSASRPNPILERPRKVSGEQVADEPVVDETAVNDSAQDTPTADSGSLLNEIQVDAIVPNPRRSEEHTSELQSRFDLVCRLLLEKKKQIQ